VTSISSETQNHEGKPVLRLALEQNREAPSLARAAITGFSEDSNMGPATLATLTLLVSEVVTNAVIHPTLEQPGDIQLCARIVEGMIRVEVTDQGSGFTPTPRDATRTDRGYGIYLVEKQATRWGVDRDAGTTVWFELAIQAA
jgi:anti-sigma regulatory factor (Ser/Thr protein kinase)